MSVAKDLMFEEWKKEEERMDRRLLSADCSIRHGPRLCAQIKNRTRCDNDVYS